MKVTTELAVLHRKGVGQTDHYGADLAVTVAVPDEGFLKTCFLQFKRAHDGYRAKLERHQIEGASSDHRIESRSFVTVASDARGGLRLAAVSQLKSTWPDGQDTWTVNASDWDGVTSWLYKWLDCAVGQVSDPDRPDRVELMLEGFRVEEGIDEAQVLTELGGIVPSRSWLLVTLSPEQASS